MVMTLRSNLMHSLTRALVIRKLNFSSPRRLLIVQFLLLSMAFVCYDRSDYPPILFTVAFVCRLAGAICISPVSVTLLRLVVSVQRIIRSLTLVVYNSAAHLPFMFEYC